VLVKTLVEEVEREKRRVAVEVSDRRPLRVAVVEALASEERLEVKLASQE
jgi:hypothetical protein